MQPNGWFFSPMNQRDLKLRLRGMTVVRTIPAVAARIAWAALIVVPLSTAPKLLGADSGTPSSTSSASLSADQVVDNLVRKNQIGRAHV